MNEYCYYACGENVTDVKFENDNDAWDFVTSHIGYDCVIESINQKKEGKQ